MRRHWRKKFGVLFVRSVLLMDVIVKKAIVLGIIPLFYFIMVSAFFHMFCLENGIDIHSTHLLRLDGYKLF